MDLCYDDDQQAYREAVRRFADDVLAPIAREKYDFRRPLSRADMKAIAAELTRYEIATSAPWEQGQLPDLIYLGIFVEEISRIDFAFASLANAFFFQVWDMAALLETDEQRQRYGRLFAHGEMTAISMSEPEAASNPAELRTKATKVEGGGWRINGTKLWTSHATVAGGILVVARKETGGADDGWISLFMVDAGSPGCTISPIETIGMNATTVNEVVYEDVLVPNAGDLTPGEHGLRAGLRLVEQARIKMIFMAVGAAQAALDLAVAYAKQRSQFGRPIASFQLVQEMIAEMSTLTETSRLLGYRAASLMMRGDAARVEVSQAKAYATEAAVRATSLGIQVHGAMGLTKDVLAEKLFRDARMLTIPDGTTEIHKLVIGRALTGISAFK
jgi:alkylation response protein AidB-like acyl-CoA dehydrogenase